MLQNKFPKYVFYIKYRENKKQVFLQVVKQYNVFYIKLYIVFWHIVLMYRDFAAQVDAEDCFFV